MNKSLQISGKRNGYKLFSFFFFLLKERTENRVNKWASVADATMIYPIFVTEVFFVSLERRPKVESMVREKRLPESKL